MSMETVMQTVVLVRGAVDTVRSLLSFRRPRARPDDMIPVYRLTTRDPLLRARSDFAIDVTAGRWPSVAN